MVGATAFQNGSCQRVICDSKLAVESERFEKRQLRLPQSKCRTHRRGKHNSHSDLLEIGRLNVDCLALFNFTGQSSKVIVPRCGLSRQKQERYIAAVRPCGFNLLLQISEV